GLFYSNYIREKPTRVVPPIEAALDSGFELTGFSDADYAECKDTFKSTFGGAQFLEEKLVSWSSKKQDCTALSTAEAEYVSLSACCAQVLWMRTQLMDYGFHFNKIPIYCYSKSAIAISCNPVQHSRTKHIASLKEDVYVYQPEGFIDADHPSHVYKLKKALYGLKQVPRVWYDELSTFLLQNHFFKGTIDPTLFIRRFHDEILVVQVYVDDIIFGSTHPRLSQPRSTSRRLKGSFIIFRGIVNTGLWYSKDSGFELTGFSDADYARCKDTFKSTSGGAKFLGEKLLTDYGFSFNKIPFYCDSKLAIAISCNPVQHSRTKHIDVRYHFIKEHVEKGTIELYFVKTDYQPADLFTKALSVDRFNYLVRRLVMEMIRLSVLTTPMPELLEDATVEAIRIRAKWENDDYICRGHILNGQEQAGWSYSSDSIWRSSVKQ
nr:hypothetical protein [Tanacetum cinerariifolium]